MTWILLDRPKAAELLGIRGGRWRQRSIERLNAMQVAVVAGPGRSLYYDAEGFQASLTARFQARRKVVDDAVSESVGIVL